MARYTAELSLLVVGSYGLLSAPFICLRLSSSLEPCAGHRRCLQLPSRRAGAILRGTDVILDGYVERIEPVDKEGHYLVATIRVKRAWKGDLPDIVTLEYPRFDGCSAFGNLRAHTTLKLFAFGDPRVGSLGIGPCDIPYNKPGPVLEALVQDYDARQQALRDAANGGSTRDKFKLAEFLLSYGDEPQARDVLVPILKNEPDVFRRWVTEEGGHEALVWVRHNWNNKDVPARPAEPTAEGKVARAIFTLTGVPDPAWKDWSNLEPIGGECRFETFPLADASFAGSVLPACSFSGNTLTNVDFSNTHLGRARFEGATLSNVTFNGAHLYNARFDNAKISGGKMRDVRGYGVSFRQATLRDMEISGSLSGDFISATLEKVEAWDLNAHLDLSSATLRDVEFAKSGLSFVTKGAQLESVRLGDSRVRDLHAEDTDLSNVNFAEAVELAIYMNCNTVLPAAAIDARSLIPVERNCPALRSRTDFRSVNWEYKDLSGMDFSGSDFTGASLVGTRLLGTNLSNSNLSGVNFNYTSLSGAKLDGAKLDGATNLGWLAERKKGVIGKEDAPPATLRGTTFSGTTVSITALVGIVGLAASVDLDAPNFDNATIYCWDRPLDHYLTPLHRNDAMAAAQEMLETQAIRKIRAKWPTAKFTEHCSSFL
jgi:uncharacterized protein YjbI with pentapeptide repeats